MTNTHQPSARITQARSRSVDFTRDLFALIDALQQMILDLPSKDAAPHQPVYYAHSCIDLGAHADTLRDWLNDRLATLQSMKDVHRQCNGAVATASNLSTIDALLNLELSTANHDKLPVWQVLKQSLKEAASQKIVAEKASLMPLQRSHRIEPPNAMLPSAVAADIDQRVTSLHSSLQQLRDACLQSQQSSVSVRG